MIAINRDPTKRQLRQFAGIWFPLFCALVGLMLFRAELATAAYGVWAAAVVLGLPGLVWPPIIRPVFVTLMVLTYPIGWVVSHIALAIAYYLVLTPVGVALRALGRDPLDKGRESQPTYWKPRRDPTDVGRYFKQY